MFEKYLGNDYYLQFDVQGQVAKSTHAGIPWLHRIRQAVGKRGHFRPFDGWKVRPGKSVIAARKTSHARERYPNQQSTGDQAVSCSRLGFSVCRTGFDPHPPPVIGQREDGAFVENLQGIPVRGIIRTTKQMNRSHPRFAPIETGDVGQVRVPQVIVLRMGRISAPITGHKCVVLVALKRDHQPIKTT